MSDVRDKLQAVIDAKKTSGASVKAPPSKPAPAKSQPPPVTNRSAVKAAPAKPEKSKSSFLKKKKKKKAAKKDVSKKSSSGGSAFGAAFGRFAKNLVEEFKEATSDISPGQLLETARDSISGLSHGRGEAQQESTEVSAEGPSDRGQSAPANKDTPASVSSNDATGQGAPATEEEPKQFSSVKVQKAPKARRKGKPDEAEAEPVAVEESILAPEESTAPPPEAAVSVEDTGLSDSTTEAAAAGAELPPAATETEEEPAVLSPTQEKRTTKEKSKDPTPTAADEPEAVGIVENGPEPVSETVNPGAEAATEVRSADENPEPVAASVAPREETATDAPTRDQERVSESVSKSPESSESTPPPEAKDPKQSSSKKRPKRTVTQTVHISKEEQLVRAFQSLHKILNSEIWNPIVTHPDSKPSTIFAPRSRFDKQWATPEFRDGLKAASRLASGFSFDPEGIEFDIEAIEAVKSYPFDPQNVIKPHTELITKAIGSKATEEILELLKKSRVRKLLYSVGTRLGSFVPTIEILARIYIGLRKKDDIIPGDRLQIQAEVLMKYNKSPYTEDMGKKARNLSLNYFMDYLTEYGFKLYKDRLAQAPDGQNNFSERQRRHETIQNNCCNLVREWGRKVGVSSPAMMNLEGRLMEMTDNHLAALVGEDPDDEEDA